jgi:phosphodiesterase/alkaline phosphatase D-like protein
MSVPAQSRPWSVEWDAALRPVIADIRRICKILPLANSQFADRADLGSLSVNGRFFYAALAVKRNMGGELAVRRANYERKQRVNSCLCKAFLRRG